MQIISSLLQLRVFLDFLALFNDALQREFELCELGDSTWPEYARDSYLNLLAVLNSSFQTGSSHPDAP